MILLSKLIATFGGELREKYGALLLPGHKRALDAMARCRTEESPVMRVQCTDCGTEEVIPHSCGHRNCPHCQHHEGQQWLERQRAKLLPVEYFMVTFTLPRQWRSLVWQHQRISYDLLLKLAWQTLLSFGLNDPKLKGKLGAHAVLHTHSRRLDHHPHVHFIVPAGALDPKHRLWRKKKGKYLFNQENLAKVFRAKWFEAMKQEGLKVSATLPKDWVVDCKHVGHGDKALTYLGKYLYRGVLPEKNILRCENGRVTFRYTENTGTVKTRTLPGAEFLWLLLQHVLPKGFRRTRDYGFLHSNCKAMIQLLQYLFHLVVRTPGKEPKAPILCKACGGIMVIIATRLRPPPKAQPA
jgi:RNase P subunit RPR2